MGLRKAGLPPWALVDMVGPDTLNTGPSRTPGDPGPPATMLQAPLNFNVGSLHSKQTQFSGRL